MSSLFLRPGLIDPALLSDPVRVKLFIHEQFQAIIQQAVSFEPTKTPGPAKDIVEVLELIRQVLIDHAQRTGVKIGAGVDGVVYELPDLVVGLEDNAIIPMPVVTMAFADRAPGMFGQGRPFENKVQNRRPILREYIDDPDNPGYKRAVLGMFYDNVIRLTCWAGTNKQANENALWLEQMMEDYAWFFTMNGVNRIFFDGWRANLKNEIMNNTYYGRPIDYFVRTERLWNVSQKTLEEICINVGFSSEV
jgi:hypothetical protein